MAYYHSHNPLNAVACSRARRSIRGEERLVLEHRIASVELGKAAALAKRKVREAAGKVPAQSPVALVTAAGGTLSHNV